MLAAATPLLNVITSAAAPLTVYEFKLSNKMPPTVFGPSTATVVGTVGSGPNFATAPAALGMPLVQLPAVLQRLSMARPFHSVTVVSATVRVIRVAAVSSVSE